MEVNSLVSFTLAIIFLFLGKLIVNRSKHLRKFSIPESVVGGFFAATVVAALYFIFDFKVLFQVDVQNTLLLYFFAGIGLKSDVKDLITGGKSLLFLIIMVISFMVMQNLVGMGVASVMGMDPKTGLMAGSVSLTGGLGTTIAWGPTFIDQLGITNAVEIGVATSTLGLIVACIVGGPIAAFLIRRHSLETSTDSDLDIGHMNDKQHVLLDSYGVLWAWLWMNVALILGYFLDQVVQSTGWNLPLFVSCLVAGVAIGNLRRYFLPKMIWAGEESGSALISDISLGMFLVMALMSMKLWELQGKLPFLLAVMFAQTSMTILFSVFVVFKGLGKNYEAAVMAAGFPGLTLGTTATAIVNMTAITKEHGAAHRAFLLVPIVGGFFVGIANAIVITYFTNL